MENQLPEFRVQHFPQIPCTPFLVECPTYKAALTLKDTLCKYDLFQYENKIKPDYCNVCLIQYRHPEYTQGDWDDVNEQDIDDGGMGPEEWFVK